MPLESLEASVFPLKHLSPKINSVVVASVGEEYEEYDV